MLEGQPEVQCKGDMYIPCHRKDLQGVNASTCVTLIDKGLAIC